MTFQCLALTAGIAEVAMGFLMVTLGGGGVRREPNTLTVLVAESVNR